MQMDKFSTDYAKFHEKPIHKHFFGHSLFELMGDLTDKSVLDLGCGEGHYTRMFKKKGASMVVGVDVSSKMIEAARRHEQISPLGIQYYKSEPAEFVHYKKFDIVCMLLSLNLATSREHLQDTCHSAYHHLKPVSGRLVAILCYRWPGDPAFNLNFRKLGMTISCIDVTNHSAQAVMKLFLTNKASQPPIINVLSLFNKNEIETCLKMANFRRIEWRPCTVTTRYFWAKRFWQGIEESKFFQCLTCVQ